MRNRDRRISQLRRSQAQREMYGRKQQKLGVERWEMKIDLKKWYEKKEQREREGLDSKGEIEGRDWPRASSLFARWVIMAKWLLHSSFCNSLLSLSVSLSLSLPFRHCSGAGFTYTQTPLDRPWSAASHLFTKRYAFFIFIFIFILFFLSLITGQND